MKIADIPSDAESVDEFVDSDIEEDEMDMQVGDEDTEEDEGKCFSGGVWVKNGK